MTAKLKTILFPFDGNSLGGSHISSILLSKNLNKYYKALIIHNKEGVLIDYLKKINLASLYTPYLAFNNRWIIFELINPFSILKKAHFLRKKNIDIVHTNDIKMHLTWFLPCSITGVRHVWHQRTPNNKSVLLSSFSNLITVSDYTKNSFPFFIKSRAKVIYNPFEQFKWSKRRVSKNPKIGIVGNLIKRKNIDVFIQILASLDNNFKGIVFGEKREPIYSDAKEQISKFNINNRIDFRGLVFPIEKYLSEIDILIAPATDEAFGRNLVEAMMLGIPVIALDYGGHKEIIDNEIDGFLIKNNNIDQYIQKIKLLVENPDIYAHISKKAHSKARDKFGVDIHVKKMTEFYNQILDK